MVVQQGSIHTLRELLSKKKSPVSDAFDSNVNNSNAVNNSLFKSLFSRNFTTAKIHTFSYSTKNILPSNQKYVFLQAINSGCPYGQECHKEQLHNTIELRLQTIKTTTQWQ